MKIQENNTEIIKNFKGNFREILSKRWENFREKIEKNVGKTL